jgi:hypothetical protein
MMQQAPPSQQTNIVYNMMFNSDSSFQQSAVSIYKCSGKLPDKNVDI